MESRSEQRAEEAALLADLQRAQHELQEALTACREESLAKREAEAHSIHIAEHLERLRDQLHKEQLFAKERDSISDECEKVCTRVQQLLIPFSRQLECLRLEVTYWKSHNCRDGECKAGCAPSTAEASTATDMTEDLVEFNEDRRVRATVEHLLAETTCLLLSAIKQRVNGPHPNTSPPGLPSLLCNLQSERAEGPDPDGRLNDREKREKERLALLMLVGALHSQPAEHERPQQHSAAQAGHSALDADSLSLAASAVPGLRSPDATAAAARLRREIGELEQRFREQLAESARKAANDLRLLRAQEEARRGELLAEHSEALRAKEKEGGQLAIRLSALEAQLAQSQQLLAKEIGATSTNSNMHRQEVERLNADWERKLKQVRSEAAKEIGMLKGELSAETTRLGAELTRAERQEREAQERASTLSAKLHLAEEQLRRREMKQRETKASEMTGATGTVPQSEVAPARPLPVSHLQGMNKAIEQELRRVRR
jgi:hypothetical protein